MNRTIRGRRITIDIDRKKGETKKDLEAKKTKVLKLLATYPHGNPFDKNVEVRISPSGKGYHVIAWSDKGLYERELNLLRRICGDDTMRIYLDECGGGRMTEVLFTEKTKVKING